MKLVFRIDFLTDYHIGSGSGDSYIDMYNTRDSDNTPLIEGNYLSGMLRQSIYDLLKLDLLNKYRLCKKSGNSVKPYCDDTTHKNQCPLCRILGTPAAEKHWHVNSARLIEYPEVLKSAMKIEPAAQVRNRIHIQNRTAKPRGLFAIERGSTKDTFIFEVTYNGNRKDFMAEASFIVAAFSYLRSMSNSKNRGAGECRISLTECLCKDDKYKKLSQDDFLDYFSSFWLKDMGIDSEIDHTPEVEPLEIGADSPKSYLVVLKACQRLMIADRGSSGNRFSSLSYIPGASFLNAMAWKSAQNNRVDLQNPQYHEAFLNMFQFGGIITSPLTPVEKAYTLYPSAFIPIDYYTCATYPRFVEHDAHEGSGYAVSEAEPEICKHCAEENIHSKLEKVPDFIQVRPSPKNIKTEFKERIHQEINNEIGVVEEGNLFMYNAIESGQYFFGTVRIGKPETLAAFLEAETTENGYTFELQIGKKRPGYGKVKISFIEHEIRNISTLRGLDERVSTLEDPISLTFLTDTIIQDQWGRYVSKFDDDILSELIGAPARIINQFIQMKSISGFNNLSGLPNTEINAIQAGSAIGFKISDINATLSQLRESFFELEEKGVGLHKHQGFGQCVFNWPFYGEWSGSNPFSIKLPEILSAESGIDQKTIYKLKLDSLKKTIDKALENMVFTESHWLSLGRWLFLYRGLNIDDIISEIRRFHQTDEVIGNILNEKRTSRMSSNPIKINELKLFIDLFTKIKDKMAEEDSQRLEDSFKKKLLTETVRYLANSILRKQARKGGTA